jgi:hypothetical protein
MDHTVKPNRHARTHETQTNFKDRLSFEGSFRPEVGNSYMIGKKNMRVAAYSTRVAAVGGTMQEDAYAKIQKSPSCMHESLT